MKLTERGTIQAGRVVFPEPLNLPEGAEVLVRIEVLTPAEASGASKASEGRGLKVGGKRKGNRKPPRLSDEELSRFIREHPAPAEWREATDNPFEP